MNNRQLDKILRGARVPDPGGEFWDKFPAGVVAELRRREEAQPQATRAGSRAGAEPESAGWLSALRLKPVLAMGAVAACLVLAFVLGLHHGRRLGAGDAELVAARKCFNEIEGLFPNQVEAIALDPAGARLVLSDEPNVPRSAPLYLKICDASACRRYVTFSGQKIRVNGDVFDVLVTRQGDVLVVGEQSVWSSSEPAAKGGRYRIEARPLLAGL